MSATTWTPVPNSPEMFTTTINGHEITRDINSIFEFSVPVEVTADGTLIANTSRATSGLYDMNVWAHEDGQVGDDADRTLIADAQRQGWTILNGYSSQDRYSGPIMHQSEVIGGGLATAILTDPGIYITEVVEAMPTDDDDDMDLVGWVVARKAD